MSLIMQKESTDFVFLGFPGTVPDTAEVAYMAAGQRATDTDYNAAIIVTQDDPDVADLWAQAEAIPEITGAYYIARLVGDYNNDVNPGPGDWQPWHRLIKGAERHVGIASITLEIQG